MGKVIDHSIYTISSRVGIQYCPRIKYSYAVGGRDYVCDTVRYPGRGFNNYQLANNCVAKYLQEPKIAVYYDPKNPNCACLEMSYLKDPAPSRTYIIVLVTFCSLFIAMGLLLLSGIGLKPFE